MRRPFNLGYQLGVTMIELMITIAIIAILVAVALPSFSGTIERQRLRFAVETIVSDLRLAQTNAIAQGARGSSVVEFTVNGGDASIWSYSVNNTLLGALVNRSSTDFAGGLSLAVTNFGDSDGDGNLDVTFTADRGLDADGDGSVQITLGSTSATVSRNLLGLISVCSNASLGYASCGN